MMALITSDCCPVRRTSPALSATSRSRTSRTSTTWPVRRPQNVESGYIGSCKTPRLVCLSRGSGGSASEHMDCTGRIQKWLGAFCRAKSARNARNAAGARAPADTPPHPWPTTAIPMDNPCCSCEHSCELNTTVNTAVQGWRWSSSFCTPACARWLAAAIPVETSLLQL